MRQFIPVLVHELRTPLTPLLGASEMLSSGITEQPWANLARSIQLSAVKMVRMIDDLADLGKCDCGELILEISDIDLSTLLGEVVESRRVRAVPLGLGLVIDIPQSLPRIRGDATRLRQVALALLESTLRQVPEGGFVRVSARSIDQSVMVTVTGEDSSSRHHDDFPSQFTEEDTLEKAPSLALLLASYLVRLHEGRAGVVIQAGANSIYWFSVPVNGPQRRAA
ncbi:histidine kinase dimerization/phospho-acceptor domain-containing protein [Dehalogenimonas sp. 4OHTPN]|uniref:histidine kinase n=1 Tax=Dehalogenimonas sp. 4OHTPN TaxID=3166643 RepID=A0AAU8G9Y3_9CHLR